MAEDFILQKDFSLPTWEVPMKAKSPLSNHIKRNAISRIRRLDIKSAESIE